MTALSAYFEKRDTPTADSPTCRTMVKILAKHPGWTFEQARAEAGLLSARSEFSTLLGKIHRG